MLSNRFSQTAVFFFVAGVALGLYMRANMDFRFTHVHAHLNPLGGVALGLAGLLYRVHPELQRGWLAHAHYGLSTVGLVIFMAGFAWGTLHSSFAQIPVSAGATLVDLGVLTLAIKVFTRLRAAPTGPKTLTWLARAAPWRAVRIGTAG